MRIQAPLVLVLVLVLAGCGEDADRDGGLAEADGPTLAVDTSTDVTSPDATLVGRLAVVEDCVVVESESGRALTVWPSGSELEDATPPVVRLSEGGEIEIDGSTRTFGGGFGPPVDAVADCQDRLGLDRVWLMSRSPVL